MTTRPTDVPARARRARAVVAVLFGVNAALYASLVPRLPDLKDRLDLTNAALGTALAAMPLGALLAGLTAPVLIRRLGSGPLAAWGLVAQALAVLGAGLAGSWPALAAALLLAGALDSVVDVAQNAHGFRVQRLYGRSVINSFHGVWSVGAVLGGVAGSVAAGAGVPLGVHLAATSGLGAVLAVASLRWLLPGPEDAERGQPPPAGRLRSAPPRALRVLALLGVLAACGAVVEDAGSSWSALFLRTEAGAGAAAAGLGFVALSAAMTVGRLTGDRVVDRLGEQRVAVAGAATVAAGAALLCALPALGTGLVGFALVGLGVATLVPAVMHAADDLPGLPPGAGLTAVSWLLRVGFLASPPAVGLVADAAGLRVALLGVVVAGLLTVALARALPGRTGAAAAA